MKKYRKIIEDRRLIDKKQLKKRLTQIGKGRIRPADLALDALKKDIERRHKEYAKRNILEKIHDKAQIAWITLSDRSKDWSTRIIILTQIFQIIHIMNDKQWYQKEDLLARIIIGVVAILYALLGDWIPIEVPLDPNAGWVVAVIAVIDQYFDRREDAKNGNG